MIYLFPGQMQEIPPFGEVHPGITPLIRWKAKESGRTGSSRVVAPSCSTGLTIASYFELGFPCLNYGGCRWMLRQLRHVRSKCALFLTTVSCRCARRNLSRIMFRSFSASQRKTKIKVHRKKKLGTPYASRAKSKLDAKVANR